MTRAQEVVSRCVKCGARMPNTPSRAYCSECDGSHRATHFAGNPWPSTPTSQIRYDGGGVSDLEQHIMDQEDDAT